MSELALNLARRLNETRGICAKYYKEKREIYTFFRQYSMRLDNLTLTLWNELFGHLPDCTLIATGGVGRREVYPNSDLDLAILLGKPMDSLTETTVSLFVQILWDAGFKPSVAVGDEDQLARSCAEDLSRDTSFLESRFLAGDLRAYCDLCDRLTAQRDLPAFLRGKIEEISIRRGKTQDSGYLEPNIKLCPGGLRDAHCMMWMAKAMGYSTDLKSLVSTGALNAREAKMLKKSYKTLARVRIELHLLSRKAGDELLFDNQVIVAKNLGFDCSTPKRASESLMRKVRQATRSWCRCSPSARSRCASRATSRAFRPCGRSSTGSWRRTTKPRSRRAPKRFSRPCGCSKAERMRKASSPRRCAPGGGRRCAGAIACATRPKAARHSWSCSKTGGVWGRS